MADPSGNVTKWNQCVDALVAISDTAIDYDTDGIDIYFLNSNVIFRMKDIQSINVRFSCGQLFTSVLKK